MDEKDFIGRRGEALFCSPIGQWCHGRPCFLESFLRDKHPATDFHVELIEPTSGHAVFYVQIKATQGRSVLGERGASAPCPAVRARTGAPGPAAGDRGLTPPARLGSRTERPCKGPNRKIDVRVSKPTVDKLRKMHAPAYIVGIDVVAGRGYIRAITQTTTRGIRGISTRSPLNCRSIKKLWQEVDEYWKAKATAPTTSEFA